ncbi:hypothetical protein [Acinetobacter pittii]|uniref:Lipoprotein n=1 Tax=Acinetobacter pittii ANC 4050 TaxID=1217691 RepID=R8YHD0_ACIPI|nr:hypothetical protein [Acinetobacter pittii]EOQ68838.1 hypothetical protein F931_01556 [Acinetobacter pittii ANC 4050]
MKEMLAAGLVGLGLVGCTTPQIGNYIPKTANISKPPIGSINTAYVGDSLVSQGRAVEQDVLVIDSNYDLNMQYKVFAGKYAQVGQDKDNKYYSLRELKKNTEGARAKLLSDPPSVFMINKKGWLCVVTIYNTKSCGDAIGVSFKAEGSVNEDSFQQTLIYSGKVGNKINIGYREFSSNIARPVFNNNVEYDLSQSKEIGYKGALLEIIEATNQDIKYKVIRNFNKVD